MKNMPKGLCRPRDFTLLLNNPGYSFSAVASKRRPRVESKGASMPNPSVSSVTIDGDKFNALSTHFSVSTMHGAGMPQMGSQVWGIEVVVDMHDMENMPHATLQKLFKLASTITQDSVKDIKIQFWTDESQQDAICTYGFQGWISHFSNSSGAGGNHTLSLSLQPKLDAKQFVNITMGN